MGEAARTTTPTLELEAAVERAIERAGGDVRHAIRMLAIRQHELETKLATTVSAGYIRRSPIAG